MESYISLFRANPAETFAYLFIAVFIATIGLSIISFFNDYKSKKNTLNKMQAFNRSLKDLVEEFGEVAGGGTVDLMGQFWGVRGGGSGDLVGDLVGLEVEASEI